MLVLVKLFYLEKIYCDISLACSRLKKSRPEDFASSTPIPARSLLNAKLLSTRFKCFSENKTSTLLIRVIMRQV